MQSAPWRDWLNRTGAAHLYRSLREIAASRLRRERRDHTLQPTALAHEAWMRLACRDRLPPNNTGEFAAAAAREIRCVLVDHARGRLRAKRGGGMSRKPLTASLTSGLAATTSDGAGLLALNDAINRLDSVAPRAAQAVQLRFIAGLSTAEAAAVLGVTARTLERDWQFARAWLYRELNGDPPQEA